MSDTPGDDTRAAQRLAERAVETMRARDAFSAWLGLDVVRLGPGRAAVRMTVRHDMLNGFGVCHGGVTFALADSALAFASNTRGRVAVSVESGISYPAPVQAGDVLTADAREASATARLAFYSATVRRADGVVVALFRGTVYRTRRDLLEGSASIDE